MNKKKTLKIFSRSVWTMTSIFLCTFMTTVIVGGDLANENQAAINGFLNTNPYEQVETDPSQQQDTEYFKSDFMKNGKYDDKAMRANSQEVALQAAVEGSVLLWNDEVSNNEKALPLKENTNVSLFGISSVNYAYLGDGSGAMSVTTPNSMRNAFLDHNLNLNSDLYLKYSELSGKYKRSHRFAANEAPFKEVESVVNSTINNYNDAAVMIVSRVAGEHHDILNTNKDEFLDPNNYLELSNDEADVLKNLTKLKKEGKFKRVILLINSANPMQFKNIKNNEDFDIDSCVWVGMAGSMSYSQIASVLSGRGDYVVSGKLPDTFVFDNKSHPSQQNFGDFTWKEYSDKLPDLDNQGKQTYATYNIKYIGYQEGIYVGYKYYETRYEDCVLKRGNASSPKGSTTGQNWNYTSEVAFPFGYGLSYTNFEHSDYKVKELSNGDFEVSMNIKNSGQAAGKDVLQVYLQKQYVEGGLEKSSVELVGFAKTQKLEPGEDETLKVTVKKEDFKTYDADFDNGDGTFGRYVVDEGKYYLAAGTNSHDALNNILAKKGKNVSDGMDYDGKSNFTYEINVKEDKEKYAISTATNNPITNQFSDADLNKYEGTKDDQSITYLSRGDYDKTYPSPLALNCTNDIMVQDMQYGEETPYTDEDEMPIYGTVTNPKGRLTLISLKGVEFDNIAWQHLLNQMTVEEQQYLISYGLHHIAGAESVAAPGVEAKDGPAGIKVDNPTLGTQMSFPSEVTLAATFDLPLLEKLGLAFGHEILHANFNAIYAPGGCIHRSPYGGRNWEYFSEDAFLSGKMLASEVKGIQKKGVIVFTKHFALNDQEENRYGVATWANEQSIRETYLKAFEIAVVEGKMNGVMSSFNRIGTTWAGAHKGLLTNVLRNEWGFTGIVETDSCTGTTDSVHHMTHKYAKSDGLLAGNDLWMDKGGNTNYLKDHLNNPVVMQALRLACHRILFAQLNSNAMNGVSKTTEMVYVGTWWQRTIEGLKYSSIILFALCTLMAILSFVVNTKFFDSQLEKVMLSYKKKQEEKKIMAMNGGTSSSGDNPSNGDNKSNKNKKKIGIIATLSTLAVAGITCSIAIPLALNNKKDEGDNPTKPPITDVHTCEEKCEVCGGCLNLDCEEEVCAIKCGQDKTEYKFEAEEAKLIDGKQPLRLKTQGDNTFVENLNDNLGAAIEFKINSPKETTGTLAIAVSKRKAETIFAENMLITVNNIEIRSQAKIKSTGTDAEGWYDFYEVRLGCIDLVSGENVIKFTQMNQGNMSGYNFDYIKVLSTENLTYIEPTYDCTEICPICNKCMSSDCKDPTHSEKCGIKGSTAYQFEAEEAIFKDGNKGKLKVEHSDKYPNDQYQLVGGLSENKGASVTFEVFSKEGTTANLIAAVTTRSTKKLFTDGLQVKLNGEVLSRGTFVPQSDPKSPTYQENGNDWFRSTEVNLGCVELLKGLNTIEFIVASTDSQACFNFDYIKLNSLVPVSTESFEEVKVTDIKVISEPFKKTYFVGEKLDINGLIVNKVLSDGREIEIPLEELEITPTNGTSLTEEHTKIIIKFESFTKEILIAVIKKPSRTFRIEAEHGELIKGSKDAKKDTILGYVGELNQNLNGGFKVKFTAKTTSTLKFYVNTNVRKRQSDLTLHKITNVFDITLNDRKIESESSLPYGSENLWYDWKEVYVNDLSVEANKEYELKFIIKSTADVGVNFNYIKFVTDGEIETTYEPHACEHKCPICDKCLDEYCSDFDSCKEKCGDAYSHEYRFESEEAKLTKGTKDLSIRDGIVESTNGNVGAKIEFTINAKQAGKATLIPAISAKNYDKQPGGITFDKEFKVTVNGVEHKITNMVPQPVTNKDVWDYFYNVNIGCIDLIEGSNTITFECLSPATNFDYITIKTDCELENSKCSHQCPTCGKCLDENSSADSCKEKCNVEGVDHKFNAIDSIYTNGSKDFKKESNGALGNVDENKGATIKFEINSSKACVSQLIVNFNVRSKRKVFTDGVNVFVNGKEFKSKAMRPVSQSCSDDWNYGFVDINLGCINLVEGKNIIEFKIPSDAKAFGASNFMYMNLKANSDITWYENK